MWRRHIKLLLPILFVAIVMPIIAQQDDDKQGRGLIIEANIQNEAIGFLNPMACDSTVCERVRELLFPSLFAVDPATGLLTNAAEDNFGLVVDVQAPESNVHQLRIRDDLTWSDGTPITAYDVFFSYLATQVDFPRSEYRGIGREIEAARLVDEYTVEFAYREPDCTVLGNTNFPIVPAHVQDDDFVAFVDEFEDADNINDWFEAFIDAYSADNFLGLYVVGIDNHPLVTAGSFELYEKHPEALRLSRNDGVQAIAYNEGGFRALDGFLDGESNVVVNPPYERWAEITATPDIQVAEYTGQRWDAIVFNLASRNQPRNAFAANGALEDQGIHPIFGDIRVRQAIQKAINVQEVIDTVFLGYATPLVANQLPTSWAFNADLDPVGYDPYEAERLLYEAGWRDANRDGIRECTQCETTYTGRSLLFELIYPDTGQYGLIVEIIRRQLRDIGMDVSPFPVPPDTLRSGARSQTFDAYLATFVESDPIEVDQTHLFTRAGDVLRQGDNHGSYYNLQVELLMEQARTLPGCDVDARAEIYHEIQAIVQADQPYVWLYVPHEMTAAQGGVLGFDPYPSKPFWNIEDWVVIE